MPSILIVDDHILFREGLNMIISHWGDFELAGEAADGTEAVQMAADSLPDIVLMDVNMPLMNGIEATGIIKREFPSVRVVMLTVSEDDENLFEALKAGASGYILKDTPSRRLHDLLRGVMHNETPISGAMATKIVEEFNHPHAQNPACEAVKDVLSEREQAILGLLAQGLTNNEIGKRLFLSESMIKKNLHNILQKLHLNNRVEAAAFAVKEGMRKP